MPNVPLYNILAVDPAVLALLGTPPRISEWGMAPEGVAKPYVVWQGISGSPENNLSARPEYDNRNVQVDVYGSTATSVDAVVAVLTKAIEAVTHITGWYGAGRDIPTNLYRFTFAVDWFVKR